MVKFDKFQSSLVKLSGSSSVDALINEIVSYIREIIKNISPDKIDPSLLRFICNVVENSYSKKSISDNVDEPALLQVFSPIEQCTTPLCLLTKRLIEPDK